MLVLLLEPKQARGSIIFEALRDLDISLYWVNSADEADQALFAENFDLVVVDLVFLKGRSKRVDFLCNLWRKSPGSSLLAITGEPQDALALGGCVEAIVAEPLDLEELRQRIRRLSDKQSGSLGMQAALVGGLYVNFAFKVVEVEGVEVMLTSREFAILRALASQSGAVVSKNRIMESAFDTGESLGSNSLEVHIHNLRDKIGRQRIATVRGQGYRLKPLG